MIRIYGENTRGSYTQVTHGLLRACKAHGLLEGFVPTVSSLEGEDIPGSEASVAICSGSPSQIVLMHTEGKHQKMWYMLAANSEGIDNRMVLTLRREYPVTNRRYVDGILTPSEWSKESIQKNIPEIPVVVIPHGVDPTIYEPLEALQGFFPEDYYEEGQFRVLHITSSDKLRKGTLELIQAWKMLEEKWFPGAQLGIMAHPMAISLITRWIDRVGVSKKDVVVYPGLGMSDRELVYLYNQVHVVCQPSRAEGFGLVPLEARCCGTPVVATTCSGHGQHMNPSDPGVISIAHGPSAPSDDYNGSTAPSVKPEDIAEALLRARSSWTIWRAEALHNARELAQEWAWEKVSEAPLRALLSDAEGNLPV